MKQEVFSILTNELVHAILTSIDEAIHVVNEDGITIFYNHIAAKHDGLDHEEVLGKHILEVFPSLSERSSTLLKVITTKQPIYHLPQTYTNVKGKLIDTINTTLPIKVDGHFVGAIEIAKDYSTMKILSDRLIDLQKRVNSHQTKPLEVVGAGYTFDDIVTNNNYFISMIKQAKMVATTSSTILVYGETGTGKELLVQSIHNASPRNLGPFIAQNCAALPESLLESILFGTVKGSYTGAIDRAGLFEIAHGGTLFLDEINSMPLHLQSRLLRVLEDGMVRRIGGTNAIKVDVRVIAAMNKPPYQCLEDAELRPDLFYRLNVYSLEIPPLSQRKDDITLLTNYFINYFNKKFHKQVAFIDDDVKKIFIDYSWPGNVRELKHIIEHMMNTVDGPIITFNLLPSHIQQAKTPRDKMCGIRPLRTVIEETEKDLINQALLQTNGNVVKAAKLLGLPRQTLQYKIQKHTER